MSEVAGDELGDELLRSGHFAKKQLFCRSALIAWSHGSRFRLARKLVAPFAGQTLLDYGCGDGSFLVMVSDLFPGAVGADIDAAQVADCGRRLGGRQRLTFLTTGQLNTPGHEGAYGVVTCMETLEHCVDDVLGAVLADLHRLVAPGGTVIISVPVEIGPALPLKQLLRRLAAWRGLGDYRFSERYSLRELLRMTFAGARTEFERNAYEARPGDASSRFHGHKGFNWRRLRLRLEERFEVAETRFSPLGWSRGLLSSQCWYVCRPRPLSASSDRT